METTVNEYERTYHTWSQTVQRPPNPCEISRTHTAESGPNIKFGQRSKLKRNPRDAYGFRRMSAFEATMHEVKQPVGSCVVTRPDTDCPTDGIGVGMPLGIQKVFHGVINEMSTEGEQSPELLRQRAEADLAQSDVNILLMAAFLPATLKNIYSNLKKLDGLLDVLHDEKAMRRLFKGESKRSLYLQWLFVWNQAYRDTMGLLQYLKGKARPIGSLVTGRSRATSSRKLSAGAEPYSWGKVGLAICTTDIEVSQRCVAVARVTCDVSLDYNATGLDNPVYLIWDLLRWSWVVDQLVDVGSFISSITSMHGLDHLGTCLTTRSINSSIVTIEPMQQGVVSYEPQFAPGFSHRKTVSRQVYDSPFQGVAIRNPFRNSIMISAAVAAAVSLKMRNTNIDPILRVAR